MLCFCAKTEIQVIYYFPDTFLFNLDEFIIHSLFIKFFVFYTGMTQVYLFSDLCRVMMEQLFKKFQMYDFLPVLIVMYITKFKLSIANLIQVFFISIVNTYVHYRLIYYHFGRSFSSNFYLINTTSSLIDSLNC